RPASPVPGEREVALDHLAVAAAAVGPERRPDAQRPRAPRVLRGEEAGVRMRIVGGREEGGVGNKSKATVVRNVEPLVPVGDDGVRPLDALGEVASLGSEAGEEAE